MNANTTSAEPPRLVDALCPLHSTYIQKCTVHFIYTVQYIFFSLSATCFLGTRYSNLVTLVTLQCGGGLHMPSLQRAFRWFDPVVPTAPCSPL